MKSASFTGHRVIQPNHYGRINELVMRSIQYLYNEGCRIFYTGGALGFDTICAQQVILFRLTHPDVELRVIVPCENQNKNWSYKQTQMYEYILSGANSVQVISEEYTSTCMYERNRRLAEVCDYLVAYVGKERSGSSQTMRLAKESGKTVFNIFPTLEKEN